MATFSIKSGDSGDIAHVSRDKRLDVSARTAPRQFYISRDEGQAYSVVSLDAATADGEDTFYIKNTSTDKTLIIDKIIFTSDAIYIGHVKFATFTSAITGTDLTAPNLNTGQVHTADAQIKGNGAVVNIVDDGLITVIGCPIDGTVEFNSDEALRLAQNKAISVESKSIASVAITCYFHYESSVNE